MTKDERRRRAHAVAEARYRFRWHLGIYVAVNAVLVGIWSLTTSDFPWPLLPIVFWGIGLTSHYVSAYRRPGWIERETDRILADEEKRKGP
jgi:hypothetical protein